MTRIRLLPFGFIRIPGKVIKRLGFKKWVSLWSRPEEGEIIISEWPERLAKAVRTSWDTKLDVIHIAKCMNLLQSATSSIMIVDPHFLQPEYREFAAILLSFVPEHIPTKIVACKGGKFPPDDFKNPPTMDAWMITSAADGSGFLHDRFVIVDGAQGLHFGNALVYQGSGMILITDIDANDCQKLSKEITDMLNFQHVRQDLIKVRQL